MGKGEPLGIPGYRSGGGIGLTGGTTPKPKEPAPDALLEAHNLIRGERLKFYGLPHKNFRRIAEGWTAYLRESKLQPDAEITEHDVASLMIILKVMRQATGYHRDSVVDTAGYAGLQELLSLDEDSALAEDFKT